MSTAHRLRLKAGAGRVLLALLVASAVGGVYWFRTLPDDVDQAPPDDAPAADKRADMVTRDFRHVETRLNRTVWILESAQAEMTGEVARLTSVKVTWFGKEGSLPVVVTSATGDVDFRKRKAALDGNVRVERADGAVLATERLIWDERRKHLWAPQPVVITTPTFTFQGERFDADLDSERFVIAGSVRGDIRVGVAPAARPSWRDRG